MIFPRAIETMWPTGYDDQADSKLGEAPFEPDDFPYAFLEAPPASGKSRALMFVALDKRAKRKAKGADA